jgi:methionine aminopeptidase
MWLLVAEQEHTRLMHGGLQDGDIVNVDVTALRGGGTMGTSTKHLLGRGVRFLCVCGGGQRGRGSAGASGGATTAPMWYVAGGWVTQPARSSPVCAQLGGSWCTLVSLSRTHQPPRLLDCCCGCYVSGQLLLQVCGFYVPRHLQQQDSYGPCLSTTCQAVVERGALNITQSCCCVPPPLLQVDAASKALIRASHDSLMAAVAACRPGVRFRDLGDTISRHVSNAG